MDKFLTYICPIDCTWEVVAFPIKEGWYYSVMVESKSNYEMKMNWVEKQIEIKFLQKNDKVIVYRMNEIDSS